MIVSKLIRSDRDAFLKIVGSLPGLVAECDPTFRAAIKRFDVVGKSAPMLKFVDSKLI